MKNKTLFILFMLVFVLFIASTTVWAAGGKPNDKVTIAAQNSTPGGVIPDVGGGGNSNVSSYEYTINDGESITDSLPISLCASVTEIPTTGQWAGQNGYPIGVHFGPQGAGGNLPGVTSPADVTFNGDGCQTPEIGIDTGPLTPGDYSENIVIGLVTPDPVDHNVTFDGTKVIHIKVHVNPAVPTVTCFVTDSDFNFLLDCGGNPVTSGDGGRFTIQVNKSKNPVEVSTQPGQFYYNALWTNSTGGDVTVKVVFTRSGVHAHGTQAIHASVFPSFPVLNATNFQQVNSDIPSGADDMLEGVVVPNGWTLWVDYHLEWNGLGLAAPGNIGLSCGAANQPFHVTATITNLADSSTIGSCTAGAIGYKK